MTKAFRPQRSASRSASVARRQKRHQVSDTAAVPEASCGHLAPRPRCLRPNACTSATCDSVSRRRASAPFRTTRAACCAVGIHALSTVRRRWSECVNRSIVRQQQRSTGRKMPLTPCKGTGTDGWTSVAADIHAHTRVRSVASIALHCLTFDTHGLLCSPLLVAYCAHGNVEEEE